MASRLGSVFSSPTCSQPLMRKSQHQRIGYGEIANTISSQWGNLLVLSACYKHPILQRFISRETLQGLFSRTIDFFRLIAHDTSPLAADMRILMGLAQELQFPHNEFDMRAGSSFSSATSVGPQYPMQYHGDNHHPGTPIMPPPPASSGMS
jgi:hypothetical protein